MRFIQFIAASLAFASFADAGTISLEIRHLWKGEPLTVPSAEIETAAGEKISVTRLSYLLSQPQLQPAGGDKWVGREDWHAFVDNLDSEISTLTLGGVPSGDYSGLQLHVGLNAETDGSDPNQYAPTHPLNPVVNNLYWTPQKGYIFLALEGRAGESGFSYHLGHPRNQVAVTLPVDLKLKDAATVSVDFHIDKLLDEFKTQEQTSTHSREGDPVAEHLKTQLAKAFTIRGVRGTGVVADADSDNDGEEAKMVGTPYAFKLKAGFPMPNLPTDYPLTNERVELGKQLFFAEALSRNFEISCAACHASVNALSDSERFSFGVERRQGTRQSMTLFNLAWKGEFFWDGRAGSLREQALMPIQDHLEMDETLENVVRKIGRNRGFQNRFEAAFGDPEVTAERIGIAIEQFVMTQTSIESKFDAAMRGEEQLTEQEQRGFELFNTEYDPRRNLYGADCFHCHGGAFFTDYQFHDNGLKPTEVNDLGRGKVTKKETDNYKFSTPSLRNIALSAPYMHDGRYATLEEAVAHYAGNVHRNPNLDPNLAKHPDGGIPLSKEDQEALVAFLKTLTDKQFDWIAK